MLFTSYSFIIFLLITFTLYYLPLAIIKKNQLTILVLASFVFYAYETPSLLFLLLFSILANSIFSYCVYRVNANKAKAILLIGVIFNLSLLAFFKYSGFIASSISNELNGHDSITKFLLTIPLPIGISFYTFEGISLLMDLHSGKKVLDLKESPFTEHVQKTAFFISFFPHLIAGPILKARDFYPQMGSKYFADIDWSSVMRKLILGYFLKMVVADNLNEITSNIEYPYFLGLSSVNLLLLLFGYSMQIFADFAGYSLIAIGLGVLFGYRLAENFNFPYISATFSEFWRRWHISLSTWLRDYLYIPLGGNKKGELRTYFNLFIVMFLGGLWHGAAWSYAVWGSFHGAFLMIERFIQRGRPKVEKRNPLSVIFVFVVITFLWLLFKLTHFSHVVYFIKALFTNTGLNIKLGMDYSSLIIYLFPVVIYHIFYLLKEKPSFAKVFQKYDVLAYGIMLFLVVTNHGASGAFIYFQF